MNWQCFIATEFVKYALQISVILYTILQSPWDGAGSHAGNRTGKEKPRSPIGLRGLSLCNYMGLIVAAKCGQQVKQAEEQVIDADVQCHRGHDVVGLTAMDDLTCLVQDQA